MQMGLMLLEMGVGKTQWGIRVVVVDQRAD
jgi:hypothetical protein